MEYYDMSSIPENRKVWGKQELKDLLSYNILKVTFEKLDKSTRVMKCTLMPLVLQEQIGSKKTLEETLVTTSNRKENDRVISVWDIDSSGWRSFRLDSIHKVEYNDLEL